MVAIRNTVIIILSGLLLISCDETAEVAVDQEFELRWEVKTNYIDEGFRSEMTLVNQSEETMEDNWTIWFNFMRMVDSESLPPEVEMELINGNFYSLRPGEEYQNLEPGEELSFTYDTGAFAILKSDAPVGAYLEFDDGSIVDIGDAKVEPFEREEQTNRNPDDEVPVETPDRTFDDNSDLEKLATEDVGRITPTPVNLQTGEGQFEITEETQIYHEAGLETEARLLAEVIESAIDLSLSVSEDQPQDGQQAIQLETGDLQVDGSPQQAGDEAYNLQIATEQISITGTDAGGVFYAVQSLRSMIYDQAGNTTVDAVTVEDAPGLEYRGLHLDVSRNFYSVESVKKLLDAMAYYKLNRFHFHLTDDEGWRLEIEAFPELTEIGGRRGHTEDEQEHLIPSYGSGPDPDDPESLGSGWYSQREYMDILEYADDRHIKVIPEIDIPGHARAAKVAMKNRYDRLIAEGRQDEADELRIHDPEDESEYMSVQRWDDNVINVCQESTYRFLEVVFDEIIEMHEQAGMPLSSLHVGGDEVPGGAWEDSPVCHELFETSDEVDSADDLMDYTFDRVSAILAERDLKMAAWEEFSLVENPETGEMEPNPKFAGESIPYVWSNIWGAGTESYSYQLANAGYNIVMSHASNFYFDLTYTKHPEEAGLYWAGFVDTPDPFAFIPFDLYASGVEDAQGREIPEGTYDDFEQLTEEGRDNILGLQGQLWAETFRYPSRVEYMALPRIISLAERAWNPEQQWMEIEDRRERLQAKSQEWNEFANRLGQRELPVLDQMNGGYDYRLPPPGAIIQDGTLQANVSYPGLEIRYTTDGTEPDENSTLYEEPVEVDPDDIIKLRAFGTTGRGGRVVEVTK